MILLAGDVYTVKVNSGELFNLKSDDEIKSRAALLLRGVATVHSAERPALSRYWFIRMTPGDSIPYSSIANSVRTAFNQLGYKNAVVLNIERGERDGDGIAGEVVKPAGTWVLDIVRWIALGIAAGIVVYLIARRSN